MTAYVPQSSSWHGLQPFPTAALNQHAAAISKWHPLWLLTPCSLSIEQLQLSLFLSLSASLNCVAPKSSSLVSPFYHLRRPPKLLLSSPFQRLSGHWALLLKAASGCHPLAHTEEKAISLLTRIISSWTPFLIPYSSSIVLQLHMFLPVQHALHSLLLNHSGNIQLKPI